MDAELANPSLKVEASLIRVFFQLGLEAFFMAFWLWSAATANSWFGRALALGVAGSQAMEWLRRRPWSGPYWVSIDTNGISARLPGFEKAIGWDLIEHIETRRTFGPMLVIYLKRPDRGSWLRRLYARFNRGRLLPSYYIGYLISNADIWRMQGFIDAHYASWRQGANSSELPNTQSS